MTMTNIEKLDLKFDKLRELGGSRISMTIKPNTLNTEALAGELLDHVELLIAGLEAGEAWKRIEDDDFEANNTVPSVEKIEGAFNKISERSELKVDAQIHRDAGMNVLSKDSPIVKQSDERRKKRRLGLKNIDY